MKKNILTFLVVFLALNLILSFFTRPQSQDEIKSGEIGISLSKNSYDLHDQVSVDIKNNTDKTATIKNECPEEPLDVLKYSNSQWVQLKSTAKISCEGTTDLIIAPQTKTTVTYPSWNNMLFNEMGRYKIKANILLDTESKTIESPEFQVNAEGWFGYLWTMLFYQPLFNFLILLIQIVPGKDLGLAIILLTILIRTILLIPSQNALKSQRKLQEIQPKLARVKEQHKENQEMLAMETMKIWKEHKVNPLGSCLPMLIQFPVLIALYYVIRNGLNPDNVYLLYPQLKDFVFENIHTNFLNLMELTKINLFVLPLIVGGLQFLQMKLALIRTSNVKKTQKNDEKKKVKDKPAADEMEIANKMMIYVMPVMIALFTASTPSGVGLYWAVSTTYGICQQLVVNRQSERSKTKVKVLS